jgi:hypothetical protein
VSAGQARLFLDNLEPYILSHRLHTASTEGSTYIYIYD